MTAVGYQKLQDELGKLINKDRPEIIKDIAEARGHGDLSENAEYQYAKEQQINNALAAKNGTLVQLSPGDPRYIGELEHGRLVIDGNDLISRDSEVFKLRHKMMYNGSIYIVLLLDKSLIHDKLYFLL